MNNSPILQYVLDRLILVREFNNNEAEINNALVPFTLVNSYAPRVITDFNIKWDRPDDHLDIVSYRNCLTVPANQFPYFTASSIDDYFPQENPNFIAQPRYTSILPLLITAQNAKIDFRRYDIVSERNSLRKTAMNKEEYVIGVVRFGRTLLLRRHDN